MKWIVGLDLRAKCNGALQLASWMHSASSGGHAFKCVHVIEERELSVLRDTEAEEFVKMSREFAWNRIKAADAEVDADALELPRGDKAERVLSGIAQGEHAGLIIGRNGRVDGHEIVRLGRVARRLVRGLPGPIMVVPPDLEATTLGTGPVLCLTDFTEDSRTATKFARQIANDFGRKLLLVHGVPTPEDYWSHYIEAGALNEIRKTNREEGLASLQRWVAENELGECDLEVVQGWFLDRVLELRAKVDGLMLVSGSRRLKGIERLFLASRGSDLAALAPCPVAIIPPETSAN